MYRHFSAKVDCLPILGFQSLQLSAFSELVDPFPVSFFQKYPYL